MILMLSKTDYKFFKKAYKVATISDYHKTHVGCVAVYQGKVIGIGCNCNKTHPIQYYYNKFREQSDNLPAKLHAEINCLNQLKNLDIKFSKVKLYIYRICENRPHGIARPCPSCLAAIRDLGIRDIYYTTDNGFCYERLEKYINGGAA